MKIRTKAAIALLAGLAGTVAHAHAAPPPTSFTYQGALTMDNNPVNGLAALQFKLWDAPSGGTQLGSTLSTFTNVDDGLFSESLDFGAASFGTSQALWLEVVVFVTEHQHTVPVCW